MRSPGDKKAEAAMRRLAQALMVAIKVHASQIDRQGEPYLLHVLRVVEAVSDEAKVVAALHDVFEDSDIPLLPLYEANVVTSVEGDALELLTRFPDETYAEYIDAIAKSALTGASLAREVKLADLRDNLERIPREPFSFVPSHADWVRDWSSLKQRYEKAIETLEASL